MRRILATIRHRLRGEDGAVTVDWVVLTGSIIFLGIVTGFLVSSSVPEVANSISDTLGSMEPGTWTF